MGIETPKLILGGDKQKALGWLGFARQKLAQLKAIQEQGITGVQGVLGVRAIVNKMYHPINGTKILLKSFDGHDFINIFVAQGVLCETSLKWQYPVEDRDFVNRWMNTDPTSPDPPGYLDINEVLFEATDIQGKKINSGKVLASQQLRRYMWDYGEGAWGGYSGFNLGITNGATSTHEYASLGEHTPKLHAWDVPEDNTGLGEFPTFSGDIRIYFKANNPPDTVFPAFETNAAAWADLDSKPWVLIDTVPNTEIGSQFCEYKVTMKAGFFIGAPHNITVPDHYLYSATKIERDINFSQGETGKIIIIPNGLASAPTNLLSAAGWEFPGRYGRIKNLSTGEIIGRSGQAQSGNRQPYGDWSNMAREDITVEYGDEQDYAILKDPADFGGTFTNATGGWRMEARGHSLVDDGIYYKSYTCRAKKAGAAVSVV